MTQVGRTEKYSPALLAVIRATGLAVMLLQAIYVIAGALATAAPTRSWTFDGAQFIWLLAAIYVAIGAAQFFLRPKTFPALAATLIVYYFATASFTILVSGYNEIAWFLWLALLVATGVLVSEKTFFAGAAVAFLVNLADALWFAPDRGSPFLAIFGAVLLVGTAYFVLLLRNMGVVKFEIYNQLKVREQLQAERLATIINSIDSAIISVDRAGKVQLYNAATLGLLDTNGSLTGRDIDDLFQLTDDDNNAVSLAELARQTTTPTGREDLTQTFADGEKINLLLDLAPISAAFGQQNDFADGTIIIARDITKQKSLDDERDEFISVVSHELRTPVAIAEGSLSNLQLLVERGADAKTFSQTLDAAHDQILYLGQMVNDLSTLSRAQRGVYMDPEDIDVKDFANELYNKYLPEAQQRNLSLDLDLRAGGVVSVPRMAIEEIMQNLITNALKYTAKGGVTIGVKRLNLAQTSADARDFDAREHRLGRAPTSVSREQNPEQAARATTSAVNSRNSSANSAPQTAVEFSVRDTGIGISQSDQKHVFQRFWRSEDYRTRETNGTGLGLHVVEQLAAKIGTKIELTSRINHGSTFSFRLPLAKK